MKQATLKVLMDEPLCEHNNKGKTGCQPPKPGATAGGCAFDGAQIALLPIADVAHLVHGPIGCAGSSWDNRGSYSSIPGLFRLGMTTDLSEPDIIMGRGESKLVAAVGYIKKHYHPEAVFIYNTCVPAMEGDDINASARLASERHQIPVIVVDAAGFYGSKNLGNRIAGEVMVDKVVGTLEPAPAPEGVHDIALIGEFNIAGEFWSVQKLFDELGIRVLASLSGDARFKEIQTMHRSELNMVVCSRSMMNVARKLQDSYQTPWFEGSFYGCRAIAQALRTIAEKIADPDLIERTEALIERQEQAIAAPLAEYRSKLQGKRVLLYTGGVKSWSVVSALQDLGLDVVATSTRKSTEADKARIRELMGDDALMLDDSNPRHLLDICYHYKADLMVAGGRNRYTALKARLPFLDINQEREHPYAGYEGLLELGRQLCLTLTSPIWPQVRNRASWQNPQGGVMHG
ncbi:nitrogenase iron-molybdenum cofactor biosynthesis protein NifE [Celerinatantimonas sp. MCCC 1A17872]|uniref:nitrogenase iron-molybdenum cofactor biosynthesis protein NifE n=1 Tax=Celerinatantimonas sp. MCCC 1A17872 TaxID=3177514 RepID=UPI0038BF416A